MDAVTIVSTLALAIGAGWCSGINLYATVAVLGLLHRYSSFQLPGGMEVLAHGAVLWTALFIYCLEFIADKIPTVDSAWDSVQTFIRVPAGAVLAAMALGEVPVEVQMLALLLGGTLALGSHATKATVRLAAHATGTSPVVSPIVSVVEDGLVIGTMALVAASPVLALVLLLLMVIGAWVLMRQFWKLACQVARGIATLWRGATGRQDKAV